MQDVRNKKVVITGASAGLGRAIALAFAQAGAHVGLIARTQNALEDAAREIATATSNSVTVAIAVADVADAMQMTHAAAALEQALGGIDIWINNAMETVFSRVDSMQAEEYRRVTEVNYLGYVHGTLEALKRMQPRNAGHIIQIGSALAYRAIPLQSAYCASKFAIRGFTDSLRSELIHDRSPIALTIVHMPALNTPQFSWARTHIAHAPRPVGTIFTPALGAEAVLHAARYPRREYWVGGSTIAAILGTKFFPGWMDRKMAEMSYHQQWDPKEPMPPRAGNLEHPADDALHTRDGRFTAKASSLCWSVIKHFSALLG